MIWELLICMAIVIVMSIAARRTMNHNYTIGSGMFKMSEENLRKHDHMDSSKYNYYDEKGILK